MFSRWRLVLGFLFLASGAGLRAQSEPGTPEPSIPLAFEYGVVPTNDAVLITATTNVIAITITNALAFTNISVVGRYDTNLIVFNDEGEAPDNTAADGVFQGLLVTPFILERTPIQLLLTLSGTNLASITNEPPAEIPEVITNRATIRYIVAPRPPNDAFTNAFRLPNAGGVALGTNEFASLQTREPRHANLASADFSVWWTWAAPADGRTLVDLAGTEFAAVLAVYRGIAVTNLTLVGASTNDVARGLPPNLAFEATRGTTYRIAVAGLNTNEFGAIRLRVAPGGTPDDRPPVVAIESPLPDALVTSELLVVSGSAREPFALDSGVQRVEVQVNAGPRTNAIGAESWAANVLLPPGTNVIRAYAIDYAGNTSAADSIVVRYINPTNDFFAMSAQLTGTGGLVTADNTLATRESDEPFHAGNDGGRSVWYWWRAPSEGELTLSTSASTVDTVLGVYTGDRLNALEEVISNDDAVPGSGWSEVRFVVSSNTVYRIAVDAYGAATGTLALQYVFAPLQPGEFFNLTLTPSRGGTVSPPGGAFPAGARVTLTGVPQEDFAFAGWEGDLQSTANPLTFVITRNLRLVPRFRTVRFTDDFETGDLTRLPWSHRGLPWSVQTNLVSGGLYAARTPLLAGGESSVLEISTNTGPGTAAFDVRVSTEAGWDFFEFLIDGTVVRRWSGEIPWETFTFNLAGGRHLFAWRFSKDPNFESGLDAAFLDNLYLPPPQADPGDPTEISLAIRLFSEGAQLTLTGQPGVTYQIQSAPDLAGPWTSIATQASPSGIINVLDLESIGEVRRFYRAQSR